MYSSSQYSPKQRKPQSKYITIMNETGMFTIPTFFFHLALEEQVEMMEKEEEVKGIEFRKKAMLSLFAVSVILHVRGSQNYPVNF